MQEVYDALTEHGRTEFFREFYEAVSKAKESGDFAEVQYVINAWWVSRRFAMHPRFEGALEASEAAIDEEGYAAQEIGELRGVA